MISIRKKPKTNKGKNDAETIRKKSHRIIKFILKDIREETLLDLLLEDILKVTTKFFF
jgi:hypothetical protein